MKTATKVAQWTLIGSGGLLLLLGLIIWTGKADGLIGLHALLGFVLILSLWIIAAIAARAGVSMTLVTLTVLWSLAAVVIASVQERLVTGGWHWTIQSLHLVVGMSVIAAGRLLVIKIRQNQALELAPTGRMTTAAPEEDSNERSDSRPV